MRPYDPSEPVAAFLPAAQAGIRDAREHFARNFAAELQAAGMDPDVSPWLHHGPVRPAPAARWGAQGVSVLVVHGTFGDCMADQSLPFGDGEVREPLRNLVEGYAGLASPGFPRVRALPVRGRVASRANADTVVAAVADEARRPDVRRIVLVAYSKGVADTLEALDRLAASGLPDQPISLVSVAGVVMGTPLADRYEDVYRAIATGVQPLQCTPSDREELASLTQRERMRWLSDHPPPAGVHLHSVVAHAALDKIGPGLRPFYRILAREEPRNDGQVLSSHAILPRSALLAEADSDHWTFVLPLRRHPSALLRSLAADRDYPRQPFFRALLRTVIELDDDAPTR